MRAETGVDASIHERPVELLQKLIRFDTTNPPGNEAACIHYVRDLLSEAGLPVKVLASHAAHPNLLARMPGRGDAPPLLMYGHVDVVTTEGQAWTHPPFEGKIADGWVWGRGTLDMKGGLAMMISALLRAKAEGLEPPGDLILALVSGEEVRSEHGAAYLVKEHASEFDRVRYAIGEFGGFTMYIDDARVYPIMVAEKQLCWLKASVRGTGGHGAMPVRGGTMAKLAKLLKTLDERPLPVHVTPVARQMIDGLTAQLAFPKNLVLKQILNPRLTDRILPLLGPLSTAIGPILRNTATPTIIHASDKINVVPAHVDVEVDGRLLPGFGPEDLLAELGQLTGDEVQWQVILHEPGPPEPDMRLYDTLAQILEDVDQGATAIPLIIAGVTDASVFSRLGIQTYGFLPMKMPAGFSFWQFMHGADERIPVDALQFGADAIYKLMQRFS